MDLAKVNGDQGGLGGLLKLWPVDRPGFGFGSTASPELFQDRSLNR
jgi:hypothetical protein